jgi:hypothetical protein
VAGQPSARIAAKFQAPDLGVPTAYVASLQPLKPRRLLKDLRAQFLIQFCAVRPQEGHEGRGKEMSEFGAGEVRLRRSILRGIGSRLGNEIVTPHFLVAPQA